MDFLVTLRVSLTPHVTRKSIGFGQAFNIKYSAHLSQRQEI